MDVIYVAEKWGVPPWEVAGEKINQKGRFTWYKRAQLYYQQILKKRQIDWEIANGR